MEILRAERVSYTYQSKYQKVQALKDVSCSFETGKFYVIFGPSGSEKTTLLSLLAGLGAPTSGNIFAGDGGENIEDTGVERHRRENVSVIYQAFNLFPTLSITENVMYPMQINGVGLSCAKKRAAGLLTAVGLGDVDGRKLPSMLSGGQQQRVAIARALASDAKVILADEPTGNLDSENSKMVVSLLRELVQEKGYCVIIISHDSGIAAKADKVYRMKDGVLSDGGKYRG